MLLLALSLAAAPPPPPPSAEAAAFFEARVRPVLVAKCQECHADKKTRGGLALDSAAGLHAGGDNGPVIDRVNPSRSRLLLAVEHAADVAAMPPKGKLSPAEIVILRKWVTSGAAWPGPVTAATATRDLAAARAFWSLRPLTPQVAPGPAASRIDAFLGASPVQADRRTLLRRVTFGLTGLPPSPEEVDAFIADRRPDAYERVVERLLASPAHGEKWGRHWLDLVRYADTLEDWAEAKNNPHLYRDWVVRAVNDDVPYDRFVHLQLAADLLEPGNVENRAALGLLGLSPSYWKELKLDHQVIRGVVAEEWEERIHTVASTFLAQTVACARCHDHKFEPFTARDYYALAGVFAGIRLADVPAGVRNGKPLTAPGVVEQSLHVLPDGPNKTKLDWRKSPKDVAIQKRGNPATEGDLVPRGFPDVLSAEPRRFTNGSGRLDLARALTTDAGDLAARVIVNRVWAWHFGRGIVGTTSDFGNQGDRPTHPELLDDLALRFRSGGWSLKRLHREIVLSAAYRSASLPKRRLDVEAWRDAVGIAAGTLRRDLGGPAVDLDAPEVSRRTLYGRVKRRELAGVLRLFDFPDPTTHSASRSVTTTPLQQLFVLNSPMMSESSARLAERVRSLPDDDGKIRELYRILYQRPPHLVETRLGKEYLRAATPAEYAQVLLAMPEFANVE